MNNRDGASGTIGFNALAAAAPNGYTIAFGPTTPIANAPYLVKGVRYQVDSFDYICQVFDNVFTIAVAPQSRFKSAQELIAAARENPGKLTYGHAGTGTIPHLAMENFADALKVKFQPVPFRGDAPILATLLKGDIDFSVSAVSTIHGKEFRPLLVFMETRHSAHPDVPTARDLGATGKEVPPGHNGLYAPAGLPGAIKASLERNCADAIKSNVVRQMIANTGQTFRYLSGADFLAQTVADYKFKGDLIRRLGSQSSKSIFRKSGGRFSAENATTKGLGFTANKGLDAAPYSAQNKTVPNNSGAASAGSVGDARPWPSASKSMG